jgi:predicted metal-dependent peptidase
MLQRCRIRWEARVKTAGVRPLANGSVELAIAPDFFTSLSDLHCVGLLMHEMLHLFMEHFKRGKKLNHRLANIAMDLAINQYIPSEYLPPDALLPELYGLPKGEAFEFYYNALVSAEKEAEANGNGGEGEGQPKGESMDNHDWEAEAVQIDAAESVEVTEASASVSEEIKRKTIERIAAQAVADVKKTFPGRTPMHIERMLSEILAKAKVDWRQELRRFVGRNRAQSTESTRTRPNRRLGLWAQGAKPVYFPKILVGIDQSGSVSDKANDLFLAELRQILKNADGATEVAYFDTKIARKVTLKKASDLQPGRFASGGTDFNCVLEYAREIKPDLIVILTDGGADAPREACRAPLLWIIADGDGKHLPGRSVNITAEES